MSISGSNVNNGILDVSYQLQDKEKGLYEVTFSYTSKDAKTVTLDCPDLYDRMLDTDGELKSLEKKPGTNTFVLKFDDIPKDAFCFYNIKVNGKVIFPEKDPEKTLPIYSIENASVASHETLYLRLPDASIPPWTTVKPNVQIQGNITKDKCKDTTTKAFADRDVWVYEPDGFNENGKGKVIFILDGESFLKSVTPYIDRMNQNPNSPFANTAFVFVDSKMENRVFEFYLEENNKFSQFLTAQVIPEYKKKLGMEDSNNVILAAHSLAAYPVINVAKNNPDKISGVILLSPAINHNKDKALPENPSPPLSDLPIYMQIGQLESVPPPKAWLARGMTDESRLKANQDFHTMLEHNNYNIEFKEHSSGHDAIHVIDGLEKGLHFVDSCRKDKRETIQTSNNPETEQHSVKTLVKQYQTYIDQNKQEKKEHQTDISDSQDKKSNSRPK